MHSCMSFSSVLSLKNVFQIVTCRLVTGTRSGNPIVRRTFWGAHTSRVQPTTVTARATLRTLAARVFLLAAPQTPGRWPCEPCRWRFLLECKWLAGFDLASPLPPGRFYLRPTPCRPRASLKSEAASSDVVLGGFDKRPFGLRGFSLPSALNSRGLV